MTKEELESSGLAAFIGFMNEMAISLQLRDSNWAVAHGMHHDDNFSSALDIGRLTLSVLNHKNYGQVFREVVNTKYYACKSNVNPNHTYRWENTNKLLWENSSTGRPEYLGVKTGVTPRAGPCLCAAYDSPDGQFKFLVVLICSKTMDARWNEVKKLCEWAG
jgi:D-alanyl-D-alanine carboxypeptidase